MYFFFLFNRTTLQVVVTYLIGALYVHPLWFYKHQHDNQFRSKLFVACQRWWFQWRFWFVPSVPGYLREEEEHKPGPWRNPIERNHMGLHLENEVYEKFLKPRQSFRITVYPSTCFEHYCAHHQDVKLYYTASGIVTLCRWPSGAQPSQLLSLYWDARSATHQKICTERCTAGLLLRHRVSSPPIQAFCTLTF